MVRVKYAAPAFEKMEWSDLNKWAKALLIKISTITGWVVQEDTVDVLVDQFRKKLMESFKNCNSEEVEYAFRNYGTDVKDWGKAMNLSLIDEVMTKYLSTRFVVSKLEEQKAVEVSKKEEKKEDMSDEAMSDWFDETVKQVRANEKTIHYMPVMLYEWLDGKGLIQKTNEEKREYLSRAVPLRHKQLVDAYDSGKSITDKKMLDAFNAMSEEGCFTGREIDILKLIAKKIVLFDHISNL